VAGISLPAFVRRRGGVDRSLTIIWTIAFGIGHFGNPALPIGDRILGAQAAILGFTLCAYVLAALFAERRQAEARLQEALAAGR
jgi:hypothetical protein